MVMLLYCHRKGPRFDSLSIHCFGLRGRAIDLFTVSHTPSPGVAQWLEHTAVDREVVGSNPISGAFFASEMPFLGISFFFCEILILFFTSL